jgi:hypothetical protein
MANFFVLMKRIFLLSDVKVACIKFAYRVGKLHQSFPFDFRQTVIKNKTAVCVGVTS